MSHWKFGMIEVSGGRLAYRRTGGAGPPLVLSHGLTDNGMCWSRFAEALQAEFDIIMLDARGHGESSRMSDTSPRDPGRDLVEAIEGLGLAAPVVMGHSVGARATADCAGVARLGVSRVVLEDPPLSPPIDAAAFETRRQRFRRQVERFQSMTEAQIAAMGKAASPSWHDDEFPAWAASKRQVDPDALPSLAAPWRDSLSRITAPTLLVYGEAERGGLVTPAIAEEAAALNPHIECVQIGGAGHNVRRENFPAFLSAVRTFLLAT